MPKKRRRPAIDGAPATAIGSTTARDEQTLLAELRRNHPELYGEDDEGLHRGSLDVPLGGASPTDCEPSDDEHWLRAAERPTEIAGFGAGEFVLTRMPASAYTPAERATFFSEVLVLREALIREFTAITTNDIMLVETAALAYFDARRHATRACAMVGDGHLETIKAAELVDRMADRAHRRYLGAIEMLTRRRSAGPLHVHVDEVENMQVGDQVLSLGRRTT